MLPFFQILQVQVLIFSQLTRGYQPNDHVWLWFIWPYKSFIQLALTLCCHILTFLWSFNQELLLVARRVSLFVAYSFVPYNFRRWQGPMNAIFSVYECRLSVGHTQRWCGYWSPICWIPKKKKKKKKKNCTHRWRGCKNISFVALQPMTSSRPGHLVKLSLNYFCNSYNVTTIINSMTKLTLTSQQLQGEKVQFHIWEAVWKKITSRLVFKVSLQAQLCDSIKLNFWKKMTYFDWISQKIICANGYTWKSMFSIKGLINVIQFLQLVKQNIKIHRLSFKILWLLFIIITANNQRGHSPFISDTNNL